MPETIDFGIIRRGNMPYIFKYQDVSLKRNSDYDYDSYTELSCTVRKSSITMINNLLSVSKKNDNIVINCLSNERSINFKCSVDKNNYTRTFTKNDIILFQCKEDPKDLIITYVGMDAETHTWNFVDH